MKRLENELSQLKSVRRQQISEQMGAALEEGDLRENAGYDEARRAMWDNESRISQLEEILSRAKVIERATGAPAEIQLGVTLETVVNDGGEGEERLTLTLVGSHEVDIFNGRISDESPLGSRLIGRRVGDQVHFEGRHGLEVFTILDIRYE